jgi:hypothetical protein
MARKLRAVAAFARSQGPPVQLLRCNRHFEALKVALMIQRSQLAMRDDICIKGSVVRDTEPCNSYNHWSLSSVQRLTFYILGNRP